MLSFSIFFWIGGVCGEEEKVLSRVFSRPMILNVWSDTVTIIWECARNVSPLAPHRTTQSETLVVWPSSLCFHRTSRWFFMLRFENFWFVEVKSMNSGVRLPLLESWHYHLLAVWLWANCSISLCFSFPICKMDIIIVPPSESCYKV